MSHQLQNCLPVLRRWASLTDKPLPDSWVAFREGNFKEAVEIQRRDPELVGLLDGTASAGVRADALSGLLSPVAPSIEEREKERMKGEATELFRKGAELNLTERMRLQQLAPAAFEQLKRSCDNWQNGATSPEDVQKVAERKRAALASKNGYTGTVN